MNQIIVVVVQIHFQVRVIKIINMEKNHIHRDLEVNLLIVIVIHLIRVVVIVLVLIEVIQIIRKIVMKLFRIKKEKN